MMAFKKYASSTPLLFAITLLAGLAGGISSPARADAVNAACMQDLWAFADQFAPRQSEHWRYIVLENLEFCSGYPSSGNGSGKHWTGSGWQGWRLVPVESD